ncbi:hypothetical protein CY0110_20575 [Crocosphaera chwakensis CCY0110]|uniref:Uncharacterized protein n=1 Tax=Crocosphaera chwakensis CCY0110 TaxID=391612 RepID=A3IW32_9CHRO|nr:hypothetical protein CY0110_20575 [Crocosphaera chwakensis CCY0110]
MVVISNQGLEDFTSWRYKGFGDSGGDTKLIDDTEVFVGLDVGEELISSLPLASEDETEEDSGGIVILGCICLRLTVLILSLNDVNEN